MVHSLWFLWDAGYLPPPFFYEPSDVWMDWFNTASWSHRPGTYDIWLTIYPPLSFVFLRATTYGPCYVSVESVLARSCDWYGIATLHAFFVLNIFLTARIFIKIDRKTALPRSIAVAAGMPMLFALDRGNLVVPCFTCLILAFGPLLRSARARWLAAGLAVNFKVYLIAAIFPQLIRGRWRWFEGAMLATLVVYGVTYLIIGDGSPKQIYDNIVGFSGGNEATNFLDMWYSVTYKALTSILETDSFPIVATLGSDPIERGLLILPLLLRTTQLLIILAVVASWIRPTAVPLSRLTFFGVALALISAEAGGYTQVFMIYFVMQERWVGLGRKIAIVLAYILCLPFELRLDPIATVIRDSFLTDRLVEVHYFITVGPFLRPAIILAIAAVLSLSSIRSVIASWRETLLPQEQRELHDLQTS